MINKTEDLADFQSFYAKGGLNEAENLTKGKALIPVMLANAAQYSGTVSNSCDYSADGVEALPTAIATLASEFSSAEPILEAWNSYIETASDPTDLEQVAQGVSLKRKLAGEDEEALAPSILPIVSKPELVALEDAATEVMVPIVEVETLMTEVNGVIAPQIQEEDPETGITPEPIVDPLSQDQIDRCLAMAATLEALVGVVQAKANVISSMEAAATSERIIALDYFEKGVDFLVCNNQVKKGSVGQATSEIFSIS